MPRHRRAPHVHKFGGASLADPAAVRHAVEIIRTHRREPTVVVVSAMAGVTDALIAVAHQAGAGDERSLAALIGELRTRHEEVARALLPAGEGRSEMLSHIGEAFQELEELAAGLRKLRAVTPRTSDNMVSRGERLTARLLAAALQAANVQSQYVDALEVIHTDDAFGQAAPDFAATDRAAQRTLQPILARGTMPVVPGFLGAASNGEVATLGRGGSDLTATLLARALGAGRISLWKDVPGLLTADPRVVPDARVIPQLHAREAAELAYYGAKVLHPRALIPIAGRNIPIYMRPFEDPASPGTEVSEEVAAGRVPVKALTAAGGQALITVTGNGMLGVPGIAARTFAALHGRRISVSLISQASSEHSICFSVPEAFASDARDSLTLEFQGEIARRRDRRRGGEPGNGNRSGGGTGNARHAWCGGGGVWSARGRRTQRRGNRAGLVGAEHLGGGVGRRRRGSAATDSCRVPAVPHRGRLGDASRADGGRAARLRTDRPGPCRAVEQCQPTCPLPAGGGCNRSLRVCVRSQGISPRRLSSLASEKRKGRGLADLPKGQQANAAGSRRPISPVYALTRPVLVDLTADDTVAALEQALTHGMDLVLANKRPLADRRR